MLQTNLNHARHAQELLHQSMAELGISLAIIAEPYKVPTRHPHWFGSTDGSVACTWRFAGEDVTCSPLAAGDNFVAVSWDDMVIVGVYLSPRMNRAEFEAGLDRVEEFIRTQMPKPVLIAGDFNAKAALWGSDRPNRKGEILEDWAGALDLVCLNVGNQSTCVRAQGESIVDVTWASRSVARRTSRWQVRADMETLSDHMYITMDVELRGNLRNRDSGRIDARPSRPRRWTASKLDTDRFAAALMASRWAYPEEEAGRSLSEEVRRLRRDIHDACDVAMPRGAPRALKATYWWSETIAEARRDAISKRRRWKRSRGAENEEALREEYRTARYVLCGVINKAKSGAWEELLLTLDKDPWGRPYKIVRNKLKRWAPPKTETLEPAFLARVMGTLFPAQGDAEIQEREFPPIEWNEDWSIGELEMTEAVRKMRSRSAAPGPDAIQGRVLATAYGVIGSHIRRILTRCIREGKFPSEWKKANLVLLQKEGKPPESPSAYRPICLLDELGKLLERILASRVTGHLAGTGPDLHQNQFGFRKGRSTVDAILLVRSVSEQAMKEGRVLLAVSLDIVNAFNTIPWTEIMGALGRHQIPDYLKRILRSYLSDRWLQFRNREGALCEERVVRGVPQGSVLGPHLWDIGYNGVLADADLPPGCTTVCYADDTIVLAAGRDWHEARCRAEDAVACVVGVIRGLSLEIAPAKTEAMWIHDGSHGAPPLNTFVRVGEARVGVGKRMRYLGLTIDSRWNFEDHFGRLAPRLMQAANEMSRLMPNLRGPGGKARRLYATALHSMALYGAPVWAEKAQTSRKIQSYLRNAQRKLAIRVIRGYRTVSYIGATLLAGFAPLEQMALRNAEVYQRTKRMKERLGRDLSTRVAKHIKEQANLRLRERWARWLDELGPNDSGLRVREAIQPRLKDWVDRGWGDLSYRMTQVLSGHGCFGFFLHRIGRDETPRCQHCEAEVDTAQHTLEECPSWDAQREVLTRTIGWDLSVSAVVDSMLESKENWDAVAAYCDQVLTIKEEAERTRRGEGPPRQGRNRRQGRPRRVPRPYRPVLAHQRDG